MLSVMIFAILLILGLALGSFVNAFAWRLYKQSSAKNKKNKKTYSIIRGRSMCPNCKHELNSRDLVPVLSWVTLKGRCRYCSKQISPQYPLVEITMGFLTVFSYFYWPFELVTLLDYSAYIIWLIMLVFGLTMSLIDSKWQILPTRLVHILGFLAGVTVLLRVSVDKDISTIYSSLVGSTLLFGVFWSIYQISSGKWIGGGDVRLMFVIGLFLGWQKGALAVVVASYMASLFVVALIVLKRYKKQMRIAFGPFLLLATYLTFLFGDKLIDVYRSFSGL